MWPIVIMLAVLALLIVLFIVKILKNSRLFGKVVDEITEEQVDTEPTTTESIRAISKTEIALKNKAEKQKKDVDKLNKDNDQIGDYLKDKGVVKNDAPDPGKEK